ncbi:MAG: hypothetical protein EXX96DRAFT_381006 [Benjaminiella poitrasii]|nr:MAG: hypothetical protein EXX96DRAFT_381006 [Benjaminiella poitrasii]
MNDIKPIPQSEPINEDELKQIIYCLPIDPRTNRVILTSLLNKEKEGKWVLPKCEVNSHERQEAEVLRETYEQAGVRGQVIGVVGSFYECSKNGQKLKTHIKVYELQVDEMFKKWPEKKRRDRRWFTLEEVLGIVAKKPYLIQSIRESSLNSGLVST